MIDKEISSLGEAVADISDGSTIMIGGFGQAGSPVELIHALIDQGAKHLTIINNNAGSGHVGLAALIEQRRVDKLICSFPRMANADTFAELYRNGDIELELTPQGTLAERIRAGGAGVPAFFTPTAAGTLLAEGKESRMIDGRECVLEYGLKADYALIKAQMADPYGNLTFYKTARNYNPVMATAAKTTIVQIAELAPLGEMDPETIVTPGVYVNRVVRVETPVHESVLVDQGSVYP